MIKFHNNPVNCPIRDEETGPANFLTQGHTDRIWWSQEAKHNNPAHLTTHPQFSSVAQSCPTLCYSMNRSTSGLPVHHQLPEFTQTHVHRVGDAIPPSHPLSSPSPPALNLSQNLGFFKWVSSSHQWPKYWSFSLNISPSNEHPGLTSARIDWLDLLAVQGTQESSPTPQFKSISSYGAQLSLVQLSYPCMTTRKTVALTRQTFTGKVMSLLFKMLSRLVITFLPRSKHLLISWLLSHLQWFWSPKNKVSHYFHCFPIYLPWSDWTGCHDLSFLNVEL